MFCRHRKAHRDCAQHVPRTVRGDNDEETKADAAECRDDRLDADDDAD